MRRRGHRGERPGHAATTAHFQAAFPFLAEGGLGAPGAYIGRDACGGAWVFDPWKAYEQGILSGPNMIVVGQLGRGKSAFLKSYIARQHVFGRQAWVLDPKGEYAPLGTALGWPPIALVPGGSVRLNPISSRSRSRGSAEPASLGCGGGAAPRTDPGGGRRFEGGAQGGLRRRARGADFAGSGRGTAASGRVDGR